MSTIEHSTPTPYLLACDYDGTQFLTSEPTPSGVSVETAYTLAIGEHLGRAALNAFVDQGGHKHRTVTEIIRSLIPDLDRNRLERFASRITDSKLEILGSCIGEHLPDGTPWPRPTDGFVELWERVDEAKNAGNLVGTAVISAGHTSFEQKTFDMLGLTPPDVYLTDDVIQALALNMPLKDQVKPSPLMLELAQQLFLYKIKIANRGLNLSSDTLKTIYVGDDPIKDGGLAEQANVEFVLMDPHHARESWQQVATHLGLGALASKASASV